VGLLLCMFDRGATYLSAIQRWAVHKKVRKLKMCKFSDLNNCLDLRTFCKCGTSKIFQFADPSFSCDLWTQVFYGLKISASPQIHGDLSQHKIA
jgi:hypothetical protein